ncbi:MAG: calcium-binding protein [Planctomycetota bacterium]|nr:MAG: calcium-binding protein [Planctomycetota bacterium]
MFRCPLPVLAAGLLVVLLPPALPAAGTQQSTVRVSVASDGRQGNGDSESFGLSADGRYVAFASRASNLVPGDTNGTWDVFVHDRLTGVTVRASVNSAGVQGDGASRRPALSANGRYVAFESYASNLDPRDTNGTYDVFVHDLVTRTTGRVSLPTRKNHSNGASVYPAISADGRFVAFKSDASNLVPNDNNQTVDIFVRDRFTGETELISQSTDGRIGNGLCREPGLDASGRFVVFMSDADNLVPGDTNGVPDIFVRDRQTGITERVSTGSHGEQADDQSVYGSLSAGGRYVVFKSRAENLVPGDANRQYDVFLKDRLTGLTELVSLGWDGRQGNGGSKRPAISSNGRYVVFKSDAGNLVPQDTNGVTDIFLRDRRQGTTVRVSVSSDWHQGDDWSMRPLISADGRTIVFWSAAGNLVPGDTNRAEDVFVRDRGPGSETTTDTIVLAAPPLHPAGQPLTLFWAGAPAGGDWWLAWSESAAGSRIQGHPLDLGPDRTVLASGRIRSDGTGTWQVGSVPAAMKGRRVWFELAAQARDGSWRDSNPVSVRFE